MHYFIQQRCNKLKKVGVKILTVTSVLNILFNKES